MAQSRRSDPRSPWRVGPGLREPHPAPARPRLGLAAREWRTVVLIVALLLASLVLDLRTPLGFAAATSFVFPVFITLWLRRPAVTLGVAALATGLAIGGYLFSPSLEVPQSAVIFNRVGSVVAVWITAMLVLWRLRLIETVRESEYRFRTVLERLSILAFSQDRDLRYTWVYCPHLPDALEAVRGRTDGELAHVDALAPLRSPEKSTVIREGRTMRQEVVLETPRGTMVWDLAICPYPDARGEITGLVGVAVDVTERRLLQEKEWQAERLEAAGRLAGGIAHQFNNRLTSILTNVHLLQDDLPEGDPNRDDLRAIEQAVTYLGDLTQQLHAFSGRLPLRRESLDLNQLLEGMRDRIDRLRGDRIGIAVRLEPSLWPVMGDPVRLEEAVLTLVQRGCASMPAGGTLALETRNEARSPGAAVALEVRDSGVAVSAEAIDRMFEPFSEPAAVVSDPDLRLAGCHGVIRRHGGTLDVRVSQAGSVFTLRLPRAAAPARAAATSRRTPVPAGQETILLAEDERELSNVLTRLLRRAGYQVIAVPNGEEALVQLEEHGTGIDLLVSDIVMPGMLGTELARQARTRFPDLPILLTSGYGETEDLPEVDFLEKPFLPNVFLEWVRATLRQPA